MGAALDTAQNTSCQANKNTSRQAIAIKSQCQSQSESQSRIKVFHKKDQWRTYFNACKDSNKLVINILHIHVLQFLRKSILSVHIFNLINIGWILVTLKFFFSYHILLVPKGGDRLHGDMVRTLPVHEADPQRVFREIH